MKVIFNPTISSFNKGIKEVEHEEIPNDYSRYPMFTFFVNLEIVKNKEKGLIAFLKNNGTIKIKDFDYQQYTIENFTHKGTIQDLEYQGKLLFLLSKDLQELLDNFTTKYKHIDESDLRRYFGKNWKEIRKYFYLFLQQDLVVYDNVPLINEKEYLEEELKSKSTTDDIEDLRELKSKLSEVKEKLTLEEKIVFHPVFPKLPLWIVLMDYQTQKKFFELLEKENKIDIIVDLMLGKYDFYSIEYRKFQDILSKIDIKYRDLDRYIGYKFVFDFNDNTLFELPSSFRRELLSKDYTVINYSFFYNLKSNIIALAKEKKVNDNKQKEKKFFQAINQFLKDVLASYHYNNDSIYVSIINYFIRGKFVKEDDMREVLYYLIKRLPEKRTIIDILLRAISDVLPSYIIDISVYWKRLELISEVMFSLLDNDYTYVDLANDFLWTIKQKQKNQEVIDSITIFLYIMALNGMHPDFFSIIFSKHEKDFFFKKDLIRLFGEELSEYDDNEIWEKIKEKILSTSLSSFEKVSSQIDLEF